MRRAFRNSLQCAALTSIFAVAAMAQTPGAPAAGEKVTVYPGPADPCPIPTVLAESEFAITCRSGAADLLERLRRPDACGKDSKHRVGDACAVLIYAIDDYSSAREYRLPPTWTVRVGKISQPDNVAETVITVLRSNSSEDRLEPGRVYELLLPIRLINRVTDYAEAEGLRRERHDQSVNLREREIRYYPALLVGRGRAQEVMTKEAIQNHFETPPLIVEDAERLLTCMVNRYRSPC